MYDRPVLGQRAHVEQTLESRKGSNKTENTKSWEDQRIGQQPSANIYTHIPNNNAAFGSKQDDPCTEFESA